MKGFQMLAEFGATLIKAVNDLDIILLIALAGVMKIWLSEVGYAVGGIRLSTMAILFSDPFKGSRQAWNKVKAEHGAKVPAEIPAVTRRESDHK